MFNTYSKAGTKNILLILKKQAKFEIHYSGYAMKVYSIAGSMNAIINLHGTDLRA